MKGFGSTSGTFHTDFCFPPRFIFVVLEWTQTLIVHVMRLTAQVVRIQAVHNACVHPFPACVCFLHTPNRGSPASHESATRMPQPKCARVQKAFHHFKADRA